MDEDERPRKLQKLDLDSAEGTIEHHEVHGKGSMSGGVMAINTPPPPEGSPETTTIPAAEVEKEIENANGENAGAYNNGCSSIAPSEPQQQISKKQQKRRMKAQKWEEGRPLRKAIRKEKQAEKRKRIRLEKVEVQGQEKHNEERGRPTTPSHASTQNLAIATPEVGRRLKTSHPIPTPITFILDCGFDELMREREIISLGAQLTRCYAEHRRSPYRAQIVVSSFGGSSVVDRLKERFDTVLSKSYLGWKGVRFVPDDFVAAAQDARQKMTSRRWRLQGPLVAYDGDTSGGITMGIAETISSTTAVGGGMKEVDEEVTEQVPEVVSEDTEPDGDPTATEAEVDADIADKNIIYLTSESPNMLTHLSPNTVYIIGGIVDRNRHKGICYKRACDRGIRTAKLPIGEYLDMKSRFVLATNHVLEIMLKWLDCGDWAVALEQVVPKRKGGVLKNKVQNGAAGNVGGREGYEDYSEDNMEELEAAREDMSPRERPKYHI